MILEVDENRVILEVEEKRVILEDVVWEWIILKQFSKEKHPKKSWELLADEEFQQNSRTLFLFLSTIHDP